MKLTKKQWDDFWTALGEDWYVDDTDAPDDETMQPSDVMTITCGFIDYQGIRDEERVKIPAFLSRQEVVKCVRRDGVIGLLSAIKKWQKSLAVTVITVQIDRSREAELRASVSALGGKVL